MILYQAGFDSRSSTRLTGRFKIPLVRRAVKSDWSREQHRKDATCPTCSSSRSFEVPAEPYHMKCPYDAMKETWTTKRKRSVGVSTAFPCISEVSAPRSQGREGNHYYKLCTDVSCSNNDNLSPVHQPRRTRTSNISIFQKMSCPHDHRGRPGAGSGGRGASSGGEALLARKGAA